MARFASWLQNDEYTAQQDRALVAALFSYASRVIVPANGPALGGGYEASWDAGAGLNVEVTEGAAVLVAGDAETGDAEGWLIVSNATEVVAVTPNGHATNSRWALYGFKRGTGDEIELGELVAVSQPAGLPKPSLLEAQPDEVPLFSCRVRAGFAQVEDLADERVRAPTSMVTVASFNPPADYQAPPGALWVKTG